MIVANNAHATLGGNCISAGSKYSTSTSTSTTTTTTTATTKHTKEEASAQDGSSPPLDPDPNQNHNFHLHQLRFDYTDLQVRSPLAKLWQRHQNDCQLPAANFRYRNRYGLGSDLHVYTQALCNAVQAK